MNTFDTAIERAKQLYSLVDNTVLKVNAARNLKLRKNASSGLWMCTLLPAALLCNIWSFPDASILYKITGVVSIGIFINSVYDILSCIEESSSCPSLLRGIPFVPIGYLVSAMIMPLILVLEDYCGLLYSLLVALPSSLSYHSVLNKVIAACPYSFSYGEAVVLSQAIILYIVSFFTYIKTYTGIDIRKNCFSASTFTVLSVTFVVTLLIFVTYYFRSTRKLGIFVFLTACYVINFLLIIPVALFRFDLLTWVFRLVISDVMSIALILFWVLCCLLAALCISWHMHEEQKASTIQRKYFHILLVLVYMSGLLVKPCLLYLATGVALASIAYIEMLRVLDVPHIGKILQSGFTSFADDKDAGPVALTPIYLLVGCSAPIWLCPVDLAKRIPFSVLSGLVTVGIGDTVASVAGMAFGMSYWDGTEKTKEGSFCSFVAQLFCFILLSMFGIVEIQEIVWPICVLMHSTLLEAKTDQIDNLVVPLVTYVLLSV